jgi:hypothetical protein
MTFTATDSDFSELWGSTERKYIIPRYQREYSWGVDNLATFWDDIHTEEEFFFGSVVLKNPETRGARIEIIDGQQRMLTMTILYAAIRDVVAELGDSEGASGIHGQYIIQRRGRRDGDFIIRPTKGLRDYFERSVQSQNSNFRNPETKEHKRVRKNYNWLKDKIKARLISESLEENLNIIDDLVDRTNSMQIIRITVTDSYDAYRIFETVNATGVDLSVADLLKNMVFRHIQADESTGEDTAENKWAEMKENLAEINIEVARFVRYHWISSRETVTMGNLYKSVKGATTRYGWQELLFDLHSDSKLLNNLMTGTIPNPSSQTIIQKINHKLKAINSMGFSQCYVLLLSIIRNRERLNFSWDEMYELVSEIENFNFVYHTICSRPANKVETFYSRKAIAIQKVGNDEDGRIRFRSNVNAIYNEFGVLKPSRVEFIEDFKSSTRYSNSTKKKNLIRYILGRLEERRYPDQIVERPIDESISIEHILPQKPDEYWSITEEEVKDYVHLIGNLVLVGIGFNSSARNYELERKIMALRETAIQTTSDLLNQIEQDNSLIWTQIEIEERTKKLAEISYDELWLNR